MQIIDITIDVIERSTSAVPVQDTRGDLGGGTTQGVLRVKTDDGIEGHCMIGQQAEDATAAMRQLINVIKPRMLGREVTDREWLWSQVSDISGHGLPLESVVAPLDVALWDVAGKSVGLPIYKMLGVCSTEVPLYVTYPPRFSCPEDFVEEARVAQSEGFSAYKMHPGPMSAIDTARAVGLVREAVGDGMALMLDRNHGYTYEEALLVGRALDANRYYWFEDPLPPHAFDAIDRLASKLDVPINMSDAATSLFYEAANILRRGSVRMIRGSVRKLGITGLRKQCAMVEGFGKRCEIGLAGNSAMNMANLHVMLSVPNNTYYEYWRPEAVHQWGVMDEIVINDAGVISAPTGVGLGIQLDEAWIEKHRVAVLS